MSLYRRLSELKRRTQLSEAPTPAAERGLRNKVGSLGIAKGSGASAAVKGISLPRCGAAQAPTVSKNETYTVPQAFHNTSPLHRSLIVSIVADFPLPAAPLDGGRPISGDESAEAVGGGSSERSHSMRADWSDSDAGSAMIASSSSVARLYRAVRWVVHRSLWVITHRVDRVELEVTTLGQLSRRLVPELQTRACLIDVIMPRNAFASSSPWCFLFLSRSCQAYKRRSTFVDYQHIGILVGHRFFAQYSLADRRFVHEVSIGTSPLGDTQALSTLNRCQVISTS